MTYGLPPQAVSGQQANVKDHYNMILDSIEANNFTSIPYWDVKHFYPRADSVVIGSSYTHVYNSEHGLDPSWTNTELIQNKVKIMLRFTGSSSNPSTLQAKIQRYSGGWVDVWESTTFALYNMGSYEYNDHLVDLHSGNALNLDIYSTPFKGINGGSSPWRMLVLGSGTTPRLHQISFYWMK